MREFYVNLKRFDIPKVYGGICAKENSVSWIGDIIIQTAISGLGMARDVKLVYLLPEALLVPGLQMLNSLPREVTQNVQIGCQGIYYEDVSVGKNFGAFTTNRPAAAMKSIGVKWAIIGHSEERKDKISMLAQYDPEINLNQEMYQKAETVVNTLLNQAVCCALDRHINVLFCIGETAEQKGSSDPKEYEPRVRAVLKKQIFEGLAGVDKLADDCNITIGYEPVWAIGPGKIPPNGAYVSFVSKYIKQICREEFGREFPVVYGGGLKEENAAEMAAVSSLDGGLVALTKFTQPIAFDVSSLKKIIEAYMN